MSTITTHSIPYSQTQSLRPQAQQSALTFAQKHHAERNDTQHMRHEQKSAVRQSVAGLGLMLTGFVAQARQLPKMVQMGALGSGLALSMGSVLKLAHPNSHLPKPDKKSQHTSLSEVPSESAPAPTLRDNPFKTSLISSESCCDDTAFPAVHVPTWLEHDFQPNSHAQAWGEVRQVHMENGKPVVKTQVLQGAEAQQLANQMALNAAQLQHEITHQMHAMDAGIDQMMHDAFKLSEPANSIFIR